MIEIIKSFYETSKERIKNPLIGAFIFSWVCFNWQPILILLFSEETIVDRINIVNLKYSDVDKYLCYPITASLFYVFLLPFINWLIDFIQQFPSNGRRIIFHKQKKYILGLEEDLEKVKSKVRELSDENIQIQKLRYDLDRRDESINILKEKIVNLEIENKSFKNNNILNIENENLNYIKLYEDFKSSDLFKYFEHIAKVVTENHSFPNDIDVIIKQKYIVQEIIIEENDNDKNWVYYNFSEKGNQFWSFYLKSIDVSKTYSETSKDDDLPFSHP